MYFLHAHRILRHESSRDAGPIALQGGKCFEISLILIEAACHLVNSGAYLNASTPRWISTSYGKDDAGFHYDSRRRMCQHLDLKKVQNRSSQEPPPRLG